MGNTVITIGRDFGSGGREIGMALAVRLGIECYDSRLIDMAAEQGGLDLEELRAADEKKTSFWYYTVPLDPNYISIYDRPMNEVLFQLQSKIIRELADMGSCVIVGRCSDYVLKGHPHVFSCFIYAEAENRIARIMKKYSLDHREAEIMMKKTDRERNTYYRNNTCQDRHAPENYHMLLDSGKLGTDKTVSILEKAVRLLENP